MKLLIADFLEGAEEWRKWYLLGTQSIRSRYVRSRLGQFWPSISYLITVLSLGMVYAYLWHVDVAKFLPYLAASQVFWTLISGCVVEGCRAFIDYDSLIKTEYHPKSMFVLALIARQVTYFGYNAIVLIPLLIIFPRGFGVVALLSLLGMFLVIANVYWMTLIAGFLCTRFRDLPNVVASVMQIMFFITPVVWEADRMQNPTLHLVLTELNPFASLLAVVRDPLLGVIPSATQYGVVFLTFVLGSILSLLVFSAGSRRLVYWL